MAALDKQSFDYWKEEHQKYLEKSFRLLSTKIGTLKEQREEDKEDLLSDIKEVKDEADKKISATRKLLVAGLIFTMVIGAALEGHLGLADVVRALTGWMF